MLWWKLLGERRTMAQQTHPIARHHSTAGRTRPEGDEDPSETEPCGAPAGYPEAVIYARLAGLFRSAPVVPVGAADRFVVFSDLHLGDGGPSDDFLPNGRMMQRILRCHYLRDGYSLVLNGDIEELQRNHLHAIRARWASFYRILREFRRDTGVFKITGNHDHALLRAPFADTEGQPLEALRLAYGPQTLFLFHGHQATVFFERFNRLSGFLLRYGAHPLRIRNPACSWESRKRFWTERRVYSFSASLGIVSLIGHTHRPLFESLSKVDSLRFRLERLCLEYPAAVPEARVFLERAAEDCRRELARLWRKDRRSAQTGLYGEPYWIPCLFNSGCAIGKRGVTAIEIRDGEISLVHWFDRSRRAPRHLIGAGIPEGHPGTDFVRVVLRRERLENIFARIRLLSGNATEI